MRVLLNILFCIPFQFSIWKESCQDRKSQSISIGAVVISNEKNWLCNRYCFWMIVYLKVLNNNMFNDEVDKCTTFVLPNNLLDSIYKCKFSSFKLSSIVIDWDMKPYGIALQSSKNNSLLHMIIFFMIFCYDIGQHNTLLWHKLFRIFFLLFKTKKKIRHT